MDGAGARQAEGQEPDNGDGRHQTEGHEGAAQVRSGGRAPMSGHALQDSCAGLENMTVTGCAPFALTRPPR